MGRLGGMPAPRHFRVLPQSGSAAIEATLSILLMLMVATAIIEFSYWGVVRQLCRLALHETLRIAVSEHGTQQSLEQAFAAARHSRLTQTWSLRIIQPGTDMLGDFYDPHLSAQHGRPVIRNDSQREQHQRLMSRWTSGLGPTSGKTIFEANILMVELTYRHRLLSPWFRHWLGSADTRLTLQAAMQTDFHASRAKLNRIQRLGRVDDKHPPMLKENPPSMKRDEINEKQLRGQNSIHPLSKPKTLTQAKTLADMKKPMPSVNQDQAAALHPDLAEQCGTLMCCIHPL